MWRGLEEELVHHRHLLDSSFSRGSISGACHRKRKQLTPRGWQSSVDHREKQLELGILSFDRFLKNNLASDLEIIIKMGKELENNFISRETTYPRTRAASAQLTCLGIPHWRSIFDCRRFSFRAQIGAPFHSLLGSGLLLRLLSRRGCARSYVLCDIVLRGSHSVAAWMYHDNQVIKCNPGLLLR